MQKLRLPLLSMLNCPSCSRNLTIKKWILRQPRPLGERHGIRLGRLVICRHPTVRRCRARPSLWPSIVRHMMRTPKCTSSSSSRQPKTLTRWIVRPSSRCCSHSSLPKPTKPPDMVTIEREKTMAQSITHPCTNCRTPIPAHMSFCPNCGAPASASSSPPAPGGYERTQLAPSPPPPAYTGYPPQAPQGQQGYQAPMQNPPPVYAQPKKNASGRVGRQIGCGLGIILLLGMLVLGTAGFFALRSVTGRGGNTANTGANSEVTPTQAPLTMIPINATFTYASVTITIINVQRATSFADDTSTPAHGVVRLNLHSVQSDVNNVYFADAPVFAYPECFTLLLPGGNNVSMAPGGYKDLTGPARKGDQMTWIDFPASAGLKVNQMILHIGKETEEQIQ